VKGIFTRPDHAALLNISSAEELRKFTAVSSKSWLYDWAALERMGVETIHVPQYLQMGEMVASGRADFFVGEFPGADDLSQYIDGKRYIPVPNVKIMLTGSRHIAVSKRVEHSKQVFDALQAGLDIMRERGLILKGYRTSGFFNPLIEDWKVLCCAQ
jgi:ABC-type amino acid transport substrate-binding protein